MPGIICTCSFPFDVEGSVPWHRERISVFSCLWFSSRSFDDGNKSQIDNYATLNGLGVKLTFYVVTGWSSASSAIWKQAIDDGHEIGNHTQNHSCGTASAGQSDLKSKLGVTAYTMAAPGGDTSCGPRCPR